MVSLITVYVGLSVLAPWLGWLERRLSPVADLRERHLDLAYWVLTPLATGSLSRAFTLGIFGLLSLAIGKQPTDGMALWAWPAHSIRSLPLAAQAGLALLIGDLVGYWSHRLRHRWLWRVHRVHHGAAVLRALSAARLHPLDELVDSVTIGVALFVLGFDWAAIAITGPISLLYTLVTHAKLDWSYGALRGVFVSPQFHRLHHLKRYADHSVNFSGIFAFWDVVFGSADFSSAGDGEVGVEPAIANTLWHQLVEPLK
jgi:sterol desaturase/sphingolipid hydroxylase (fatty acid hydroxylase superfamily)